MNKEILLAGFGGQGILFAGKVLATAVLWIKRNFHGCRHTVLK